MTQPSTPATINETLNERGSRYGRFIDNAAVAQGFVEYARLQAGWARMPVDCREAATVILQKLARILNGDPNYVDNWHDIQGYAKLVEDRILKQGIYAEPKTSADIIHAGTIDAGSATIHVSNVVTSAVDTPNRLGDDVESGQLDTAERINRGECIECGIPLGYVHRANCSLAGKPHGDPARRGAGS